MSNESDLQQPESWVKTRLGEIAEIILGQSPPSSTYNVNGKGLPFYQGKLEFGKMYPTPQKWCTEPRKVAEKGDVLISVRAPVGPTNISPGKSCIGRGLAGVRGLGGIDTFFILYLLRRYEKVIAGKGTGTTFSAISGGQLRDLEIPLPPLNEQRRIVGKVELLFSFLDAGVASLRKVQGQLKRYRQAVLKAAFEGKLTQQWRETHPNVKTARSIVEKQGKLPIKLESPKLPDSWSWTLIGDISRTSSGGTPSRKNKVFFSGNIPWLKSGELGDNPNITSSEELITKQAIDVSSAKIIPKGSLLVALYGATVGKLGILGFDAAINQAICAIQPYEGVNAQYLFYYLTSYRKNFLNARKGGAQPNISQEIVRNAIIPLAPVEEQKEVVAKIDGQFSFIDNIEDELIESMKYANNLRQSILKVAFKGELVPQDPKDEIAEKLLERIKTEWLNNKSKNNKRVELSKYVK